MSAAAAVINWCHQAVLTPKRKACTVCGMDRDELPQDVCEHRPAREQVCGFGFKLCQQVAAFPFANRRSKPFMLVVFAGQDAAEVPGLRSGDHSAGQFQPNEFCTIPWECVSWLELSPLTNSDFTMG